MSKNYDNKEYKELKEINDQNKLARIEREGDDDCCCYSCCCCCGKAFFICLVILIIAIIIAVVVLVIMFGPEAYEGYTAFKYAEGLYENASSDNPDYQGLIKAATPYIGV